MNYKCCDLQTNFTAKCFHCTKDLDPTCHYHMPYNLDLLDLSNTWELDNRFAFCDPSCQLAYLKEFFPYDKNKYQIWFCHLLDFYQYKHKYPSLSLAYELHFIYFQHFFTKQQQKLDLSMTSTSKHHYLLLPQRNRPVVVTKT